MQMDCEQVGWGEWGLAQTQGQHLSPNRGPAPRTGGSALTSYMLTHTSSTPWGMLFSTMIALIRVPNSIWPRGGMGRTHVQVLMPMWVSDVQVGLWDSCTTKGAR